MKKRILSVLLLSLVICALFTTAVSATVSPSRLVDDAELLDPHDEGEISRRLYDIGDKYQCDIVIVTEKSIGKTSPRDYADDYFDNHDYGFGNDYTGLLLLITFDDEGGIWYISTCGQAINAFSDATIDLIGEKMQSDLASENYKQAFDIFLDECDYYLNGYANGFPFDGVKSLVISLVVGFIIAFVAVSVMKGQLTSVSLQENATAYVKPGSMNVTTARDFFLYSNVTRTPKPKDNGSSTHTSSSGRTHGGGGGRF